MAIDDEHVEQHKGIETVEDDGRLAFENVTLLSAHRHRVLIADLNLVVLPGARLLVRGAQNDVRAVLMRTIAGIRNWGRGRIIRPHNTQMMFVTEQPYLPDGTLLEILLADDSDMDDVQSYRDTVLATLRMVGLEAVLARCVDIDTEQKWTSLLTIGEQQLLVCARVLLARPRFVMLERLSVTLERVAINHMLDLFAQRGITYIVLEPEAQDLDHFDLVLDLAEGGSWQLRRVAQGQVQSSGTVRI
jgi:putative ATP-binding cassette transporter